MTCGAALTNTPAPRRVSSAPRATSRATASRTVEREVPNDSAMARSDGNRAPGVRSGSSSLLSICLMT